MTPQTHEVHVHMHAYAAEDILGFTHHPQVAPSTEIAHAPIRLRDIDADDIIRRSIGCVHVLVTRGVDVDISCIHE